MTNTEQGSEETLQLQIDALILDVYIIIVIALQKAPSELGLKHGLTGGDISNVVDTLASMLAC